MPNIFSRRGAATRLVTWALTAHPSLDPYHDVYDALPRLLLHEFALSGFLCTTQDLVIASETLWTIIHALGPSMSWPAPWSLDCKQGRRAHVESCLRNVIPILCDSCRRRGAGSKWRGVGGTRDKQYRGHRCWVFTFDVLGPN